MNQQIDTKKENGESHRRNDDKRRRESDAAEQEVPQDPRRLPEEIKGVLACTISHETMRDPVTIV